jgi:hypothetical protein
VSRMPVAPPRIAVWLVGLFTPREQAESIPGDLLEEFSELATKSGAAYARRWFWRQSVRTIFHLVMSGFRASPWLITGVVVVGLLLVKLGQIFSEWTIRTGLRFYNHHYLPPYHHLRLAMFLLNGGICLVRFLVPLSIGCFVGLISRGKGVLTTAALSLICGIWALLEFWNFCQGWSHEALFRVAILTPVLLNFFGGSVALVVGGAIVSSIQKKGEGRLLRFN